YLYLSYRSIINQSKMSVVFEFIFTDPSGKILKTIRLITTVSGTYQTTFSIPMRIFGFTQGKGRLELLMTINTETIYSKTLDVYYEWGYPYYLAIILLIMILILLILRELTRMGKLKIVKGASK
ncbi:MAG: hypothetical protein Q6363_007345, partial [Candidatus Njordarchaeota archaeon]